MRILIAPDKFKDALTAPQAAKAIEEGVKAALPDAKCILLPMADGGEGTAALLTEICGGVLQKAKAHNPLLKLTDCSWGYQQKENQAFLELAEASGLWLIPEHLRNPLYTSTFGTGELIRAALEKGAKNLVIGLGGSATNDGGTGLAAALGYRFFDVHGKEIPKPKGKDLIRIRNIDQQRIHPALNNAALKVKAACDVTNPLLGPSGATFTYAVQKGATADMLPHLEEGMENLSETIRNDLGCYAENIPGSGAAGGAGAGVLAFLNGELCSGAELILEYSDFYQKIREADLLITGEGKIDDTSLQGKLIGRLSEIAKNNSIPLVAFCGKMSFTQDNKKRQSNFQTIVPISSQEEELESALKNSFKNLKKAAHLHFSNFI